MVDGTRTRLIESALKLLREQGLDAVTLRAVGELTGLSRMAPYRHFADKTALLAALAVRVLTDLIEHVSAAVLAQTGHRERLTAFYRSYVEFAVEHREEYRLVFGSKFFADDHPELDETIDAVMAALSLDFAGGTSKAEVVALMSTAHGLAEIATLGFITHKGIRQEDVIDALVRGVGHPA
jgi:AcrR family transcriptional regulator